MELNLSQNLYNKDLAKPLVDSLAKTLKKISCDEHIDELKSLVCISIQC